jgi:hypothetical protein
MSSNYNGCIKIDNNDNNEQRLNMRMSTMRQRYSSPKRYRSRSFSPRPRHLSNNNRTSYSSSNNYNIMRFNSPPSSYHSKTRFRSRSPLSHRQFNNQNHYSYHQNYHNSQQHSRYMTKSKEEEFLRYNPPENDVLAIFGLSKRVNQQDLYQLYRGYGCRECKIIIDKIVINFNFEI